MPPPLRLVFAATPEFALPCLHASYDSEAELVAVYTQPDRPAGRGRKLTPSPIKRAALSLGICVEQPATLRDAETQARLRAYAPDLMVVVAYGLILPQTVLDIPALGCWNVHASLLPRWRGAAPIQRAIAAGDHQTGVVLMRMEAGLDSGQILLQRCTAINDHETSGTLHDKLAVLGADMLTDGLKRVQHGDLPPPQAQSVEAVTYAHKLNKAEAVLDFTQPARQLERAVRAFDPWPVAVADVAGERLRLWSAEALQQTHDVAPGTVLGGSADGLDLACGEGVLRLHSVQRAGGRRMAVADYLNARPQLRQRSA